MFFDENSYCYLNGKIIKLKDEKISPFDLGLVRGYAVTEVLRAYDGKIFLFDEHYKRLMKAVKSLRLNLKESQEKIKQIMDNLIKKNNCLDAKIKVVLSPGIGESDLDLGNNETLFIYAQNYVDFPNKFYTEGIKIMSVNYQRSLSEFKTSDYLAAICLRKEMRAKKANEILYVANDCALECSTSNIFMIKNNILITPQQDILLGVTRGFVLGLAKKDMQVEERSIKFKELLTADEVFITATTKQIMPVIKIDNRVISSGRVGGKTLMLQTKFNKELSKRIKKDK